MTHVEALIAYVVFDLEPIALLSGSAAPASTPTVASLKQSLRLAEPPVSVRFLDCVTCNCDVQ